MPMKSKGVTVAEVLVVCGIYLIISTVCYFIFSDGIKNYIAASTKISLNRNALTAIHKISNELGSTDIESVYIIKNTENDDGKTVQCDAISFLSSYGGGENAQIDMTNANILWQKQAVFYLDLNSHKIYQQNHYFDPPTDSPPALQLKTFTPNPAQDQVIAFNVTSLSFNAAKDTAKTGDAFKNPIELSLTVKEKKYEISQSTSISSLHNNEQAQEN